MWSNKEKNCCCFCLTSSTKLTKIENETNNIYTLYGFVGTVYEDLCKNICIWCKAYLNRLNKFILNAQKSQQILYNLDHGNEDDKRNSILAITNAKPSLSYHKPNININVEEKEEIGLKKEEVDYQFSDFNINEEKVDDDFLNEEEVDCTISDLKEHEIKVETITIDDSNESMHSDYAQNNRKIHRIRKFLTKVKKPGVKCVRPKGVIISTDNILEGMKRTRKPVKIENSYCNDDSEDDNSNKFVKNKNTIIKKNKKKAGSDNDYIPKNTSSEESESSSSESEKIKDYRVFPMQCEECEFMLCSRIEHRKHYYVSHPTIKYPYGTNETHVCDICGVTRTTIYHLREHMTRHGPKVHKCSECYKKFLSDYLMKQHKKRVHDPRKLQCDYCNKLFSVKTDIIKHIKMHIGLKEYKCFICNARFVTNGNLTIHMRNHEKGIKLNNKKKKNLKTKSARKKKVTKKK